MSTTVFTTDSVLAWSRDQSTKHGQSPWHTDSNGPTTQTSDSRKKENANQAAFAHGGRSSPADPLNENLVESVVERQAFRFLSARTGSGALG